jgi:hypothetical protein
MNLVIVSTKKTENCRGGRNQSITKAGANSWRKLFLNLPIPNLDRPEPTPWEPRWREGREENLQIPGFGFKVPNLRALCGFAVKYSSRFEKNLIHIILTKSKSFSRPFFANFAPFARDAFDNRGLYSRIRSWCSSSCGLT